MTTMKHLLTLHDGSTEEILDTLDLAKQLKEEQKQGIPHPHLKGKTLGMIFSKSSTRTRVSFEVGMYQLGGSALFLSANDIQLGRGESIDDTANVLSRFLDGIMIRTFQSRSDVEDLAKFGSIPIINGLTDLAHPCQILADFQTVIEKKGQLKGLERAFIGDRNNVAQPAAVRLRQRLAWTSASPHRRATSVMRRLSAGAIADGPGKTGAKITPTHSPEEAIANADAVYADTWISMGQESEKEEKVKIFMPYQINKELFAKAKSDAIFLHCLPAYRGY